MKNWLIIAVLFWASVFGFAPTHAQQSFNLDFTGGTADCASWVNGVSGGSLNASVQSGSANVVATGFAGGTAPECELGTATTFIIDLEGFTATYFSIVTGVGDNIFLFLEGSVVYYTNVISPGIIIVSDIEYDSIHIDSFFTPVYFDNIIIGEEGYEVPRINQGDWGAPIALFCTDGGGIDIYNIVDDEGFFFRRVSAQQIANGIEIATYEGQNVRILNTSSTDVWILYSGEVQINRGDYEFRFIYQNTCGALPEADSVLEENVETE
jgi:hypothetical protein